MCLFDCFETAVISLDDGSKRAVVEPEGMWTYILAGDAWHGVGDRD
jgi:hypothetical protein